MVMKNSVFKPGISVILSLLLLISVLLIGGCVGDRVVSPTLKEYAQDGVSFEYPADWGMGSSDSPSTVAALVSPMGAYFVVTKDTVPSDFELETSHDNLVKSMESSQIISTGNITVAEVSAYETVFKSKDSQYWILSLEKNDLWYNLFFSAPADLFESARGEFNSIVNSFEVQ